MATLSGLLTLLKFLPDFVALAKTVGSAAADGVDALRISAALKSIDKDFLIKDPKARAKGINDDFRKA